MSQTGLLPGITSVLQSHSTLAQDAMDADARSQVLSHLLKCRNVYRQLASLASEGRLPEAIQHYEGTKDVLDSIGPPLSKARVTLDMRVRFTCDAQLLQALTYHFALAEIPSARGPDPRAVGRCLPKRCISRNFRDRSNFQRSS